MAELSNKEKQELFNEYLPLIKDSELKKSIIAKQLGIDYKVEDPSITEAMVAGLINGAIQLPYGFVSLAAEIKDAFAGEDVPIDEGAVAKLQEYFDGTVLGKIQDGAEDVVKESAIGRLTSAFTQLYGAGRIGASAAVKGAAKAKKVYDNYSKGAKANKVVKANANAVKASKKAQQLNALTGTQKYIAVAVGGGLGTGMVADIEDIGTWGDVFDVLPSDLDREPKKEADDDAFRRLFNRFKFGTEAAVISVPIVYGINTVAKRISEAGKKLKYSNDQLDRYIDRFVRQPFEPRGGKPQSMFEGIKRVEGKINVGAITAKDMIKDIDKTLYRVAKESGISTSNPAKQKLINKLDDLLVSSDDSVKNGQLYFKGFEASKVEEFAKFGKEIGLSNKNIKDVVAELSKVRRQMADFKNPILAGENLNVGSREFAKIMSDRMRNMFNAEYEIARGRSILPWRNYKPTDDSIQQVQQIFKRNAKEKGVNLTQQNLDDTIDDIIENVQINPVTKTPEFPVSSLSVLDDKAVQIINIADNLKGNQFKPTDLIKSQKDLQAFEKFFGIKRNLRNTIMNVMQDLSSLAAKDEFYSNIVKEANQLRKAGERAVVYPTRAEAVFNLPKQKIITDRTGLNLKSPLGEQAYTTPINGYFTSEEFANALKFNEKLLLEDFAKNVFYQNLVLVPKGLTQIGKTILGPFTHTRNFITASQFTMGTGNFFKDPRTIVKNFRKAFNTIQPQLLYRNTPTDQALYKFLLEEQVVSSSATQRDIAGLLADMGKGGNVLERLFGRLGKAMKTIYDKASDVYVAEDDTWKIYNFLSEFDTYKNAYTKAFQAGKIKKMPGDLELMKTSANIVRNTVPNYNYVGEFVQIMRRSPFGNFMSFPAEITRTAGNIIQLGRDEAADPILKGIGYKRLASFGLTVAAVPTVVGETLKGMYGVTSKAVAAIREFLPNFSKDSTLWVYRDKDGSLKYIDASGFMVYDTVINPVQSVIANVERETAYDKDAPLSVGLAKGLVAGFFRFGRPFFEESIWIGTFNDLVIRGGRTPEGRQIFDYENDSAGEIFKKYMTYAITELAPLSQKQFSRLTDAVLDQPGPRGEKYDVEDELAGFYGLRPIKVDALKSLNFKINDFKRSLSRSTGGFRSVVLKGGEISDDEIIEAYISQNAKRYNAFSEMARKIGAAKELESRKKDLIELFDRRQESKNYKFLLKNKFRPFTITKPVKKEFERQTDKLLENFDEVERSKKFSRSLLRRIKRLERRMKRIPLGENFYDFINPKDYLSSLPQDRLFASLPEMPAPMNPPAPVLSNEGLTPTENALLTEGEKQIRLRQRGLA